MDGHCAGQNLGYRGLRLNRQSQLLSASFLRNRRFTDSGSSSDTSPPSIATSLANDDDTNEYCGAVATKKVSTPAMCLFICAICSSYSKSVSVRNPLTIAVIPRDVTKSTTRPCPTSTRKFDR